MSEDPEEYYRRLKMRGEPLESVIENQASQHGEICKQYVLHKSRRDKLELAIEREFARLAPIERRILLKKTGKAPTEAQVKQAVQVDEDYQDLQDEWLECKNKTRHWDLLREPSNQRSFMIGHLVELHLKVMLSSQNGSGKNRSTYDENKRKLAERRNRREEL